MLIVVSAGARKAAKSESLWPMTDRSPGTSMPRDRASIIAPKAIWSVPQMMAVGGGAPALIIWRKPSRPPPMP